MSRTALACCAALALMAGTAAAKPLCLPGKAPCDDPQAVLLEELADQSKPLSNRIFVGGPVFPVRPAPPRPVEPRKVVIQAEYGGRLDHHWNRFQTVAATGAEVEIRGACESACTLVLTLVPKHRLCFDKEGRLAFHQARNADNTPAPESTQWMIDRYPDDIRAWINAKGGYREMPLHRYWHLPASELWAMGYRRCAD